MSEKAIIQKLEPYKYLVPIYTVVDGKGIELVDNTIVEGQDESLLEIYESNYLPRLIKLLEYFYQNKKEQIELSKIIGIRKAKAFYVLGTIKTKYAIEKTVCDNLRCDFPFK